MARKGNNLKSPCDAAYKRENRKMKNKIARMKRTLKRQPNNKELEERLKKIA